MTNTANTARLLVVDDENVVRRSHLRVLASVSHDVEAVSDGEQALKALEAKPYDVVLLDLRMPGLDGMEVLKRIKVRWPDVEVVVITGFPSFETAREAVRLGAFDYRAKPLAPREVIDVTHGALEQKHWALHRDVPVDAANDSTTTAVQYGGAQL